MGILFNWIWEFDIILHKISYENMTSNLISFHNIITYSLYIELDLEF